MCPVCIATAAWMAAGAGSGGALSTLLLRKKPAHPGAAVQPGAKPRTATGCMDRARPPTPQHRSAVSPGA
jgi:hypothetical protein